MWTVARDQWTEKGKKAFHYYDSTFFALRERFANGAKPRLNSCRPRAIHAWSISERLTEVRLSLHSVDWKWISDLFIFFRIKCSSVRNWPHSALCLRFCFRLLLLAARRFRAFAESEMVFLKLTLFFHSRDSAVLQMCYFCPPPRSIVAHFPEWRGTEGGTHFVPSRRHCSDEFAYYETLFSSHGEIVSCKRRVFIF